MPQRPWQPSCVAPAPSREARGPAPELRQLGAFQLGLPITGASPAFPAESIFFPAKGEPPSHTATSNGLVAGQLGGLGGQGQVGRPQPSLVAIATWWSTKAIGLLAKSPLILAFLLQPHFGNSVRESLTKKILSFALQHLISPLTVHL